MKRVFRSDEDRASFLIQLSDLLKDGYPLLDALTLYQAFVKDREKDWIEDVKKLLTEGDLLSDGLEAAGYSKDIRNYLQTIEKYGDLQVGLERTGTLLQKRASMQKQLKSILVYPFMLFIGVVLLGTVLMEGILPQFALFYESMGHELPFFTQIAIIFINWFRLPIFLIVVGSAVSFLIWFKRKPVSEQVNVMINIPFISLYLKQLLTYYFAAQLAPMLQNGLSLQDSLCIMSEESKLVFFQLEASSLLEYLKDGEDFPALLASKRHFIPQLALVVSFGEKKGELANELDTFAQFLFTKMYERTYSLMKLIQPVFFCLVGLLVITLFLSMMLPVFSLLDEW
ncbi:type II secretion system F family protein [Paenalkalicoccus suaedae]|uniref:Type II secretion system F family protein n=1 Tax=Paenalkalicoccus suaedae TaxID=2592382 RepID=A0A859FDL3_9BACI|nr:competence type IV pilus assembly protein ComGB [Paenalkalicoccus suaedae]QKS70928.1 type II secretion system F family protein [Paenalkalicoccus suaedae]